MNSLSSRKLALCVLALCGLALAASADAAEKVKVKFTKNARQMHAESKINPGGGQGRELVSFFYVDQINTSQGLEFVEERGANTDDQVDGNGKHSGVASDVLKNGDQIYQIYAGTHKTTTKEGGAWEVNYQGVSTIIGGTGKYKSARGKLQYKGRVTPDSLSEEDDGEIEY